MERCSIYGRYLLSLVVFRKESRKIAALLDFRVNSSWTLTGGYLLGSSCLSKKAKVWRCTRSFWLVAIEWSFTRDSTDGERQNVRNSCRVAIASSSLHVRRKAINKYSVHLSELFNIGWLFLTTIDWEDQQWLWTPVWPSDIRLARRSQFIVALKFHFIRNYCLIASFEISSFHDCMAQRARIFTFKTPGREEI